MFLLPGTVVMPGSGVPSKEQDLTFLKLKLIDAYRLAELEVRSEEDVVLALDEEAPGAGPVLEDPPDHRRRSSPRINSRPAEALPCSGSPARRA